MAKKKPKFCVDHMIKVSPVVSVVIYVHNGFKNIATGITADMIIIKILNRYFNEHFEYSIGLAKFYGCSMKIKDIRMPKSAIIRAESSRHLY